MNRFTINRPPYLATFMAEQPDCIQFVEFEKKSKYVTQKSSCQAPIKLVKVVEKLCALHIVDLKNVLL